MLPKSLDGDSAGGMVITTPPVLSTAEALFTEAPEHLTAWPKTTASSVRVSNNHAECLQHCDMSLFYVTGKAIIADNNGRHCAFEHILSNV